MITAEQNDLLTLVEGETPMGKIMRSHWLPACCLKKWWREIVNRFG